MRLRLKHCGGGGEFDLAAATADDPVILGRERGLELFVPNGRVSRRHVAFYQTDAGWFVENRSTREGTYVNGHRVAGVQALAAGDRVTLGEHPPAATVLIETLGDETALVDGDALETVQAATSDAASGAVIQAAPGDDPAALLAEAVGAPSLSNRRPRRVIAPAAFGAFVLLVIAGAVSGVVWKVNDYRRQSAARRPPAVVAGAPSTRPAISRAAVPAEAAPAAALPAAERPVEGPPEAPERAVERGTAQWQKVTRSAESSPPLEALSVFLQYRHNTPGSALSDELAAHTAEALDGLWFTWVEELLADQARFNEALAELSAQRVELSSSDVERAAQLDRQIKHAADEAAMNAIQLGGQPAIVAHEAPDLRDEAQRRRVRAARDAGRYADWCQRTMNRVRDTRGATAW